MDNKFLFEFGDEVLKLKEQNQTNAGLGLDNSYEAGYLQALKDVQSVVIGILDKQGHIGASAVLKSITRLKS